MEQHLGRHPRNQKRQRRAALEEAVARVARATCSPGPESGDLLVACHLFGFYPFAFAVGASKGAVCWQFWRLGFVQWLIDFGVTVLEVIQRSTEFLARKGVDSPRLQSELLLAHVLKLERMRLYLNFNQTLSSEDEEWMRELVRRRGQREPLQQIVGTISFCGLEMEVNRHVLVPRPETELLAEAGWGFLNGVAASRRAPAASGQEEETGSAGAGSLTVLDVGTGSGCLAIALAKRCEGLRVVATDVSQEALDVAGRNAERHGLTQRITFLRGDGFAPLTPLTQAAGGRTSQATSAAFDLIVSNPPYIPRQEIAGLQPEVKDFEPLAALDGGEDGLDFYRRFSAEAKDFLEPRGKIMLEFGDNQAEAVAELFRNEKWIVEAVLADYTKRARILVAAKPDSVS